MDFWNWDEASPQEVPPGNRLSGLGRLLGLSPCAGRVRRWGPPLTRRGPNRLIACRRSRTRLLFPRTGAPRGHADSGATLESWLWDGTPGS